MDEEFGRLLKEGERCRGDRFGESPEEAGDEPVFLLASSWRSGSTLLQRMMMGECFVWGEPYGHAWLIQNLLAPYAAFQKEWPREEWIHDGRSADAYEGQSIANLYPRPSDLDDAIRAYMRRLFHMPAEQAGTSRWGIKEVRWDGNIARSLHRIFPKAKFVFLIRHPLDAYRSLAAWQENGVPWHDRWPDRPLTPAVFAEHWRRLSESFLDVADEVGAYVLRYENLAKGKDVDEVEKHLGFPLNRRELQIRPSNSPVPIKSVSKSTQAAIRREAGSLAEQLGYSMNDSD